MPNAVHAMWTDIQKWCEELDEGVKNAIAAPFEAAWQTVSRIIEDVKTAWEDLMRTMSGAAGLTPEARGAGASIGLMPQPKAGGADFMTNGPQLLLVGEAGPEHVVVTPQNNYNLTIHSNAQTEQVAADFAMMGAFA